MGPHSVDVHGGVWGVKGLPATGGSSKGSGGEKSEIGESLGCSAGSSFSMGQDGVGSAEGFGNFYLGWKVRCALTDCPPVTVHAVLPGEAAS